MTLAPLVTAVLLWPGTSAAHRAGPQESVLEQIVVHVNGDPITKSDIDERVRVTRALKGADPAAGHPDVDVGQILSDAIDEVLMVQRAADLGLGVTDAEIDAVLAKIKEQSRVDSEEAFADLLRQEGITLAALRANTRRQVVIERVRQHLYRRVSITSDEARRYYDTHTAEFGRPRTVVFREVCVRVPGAPDVERDRAIVRVVRAGDRLKAGADMALVARELSDAPSKNAGGLVGPVEWTSVDPALRSALAATVRGRVSGPVRARDGYCVVRLEEDRPPVSASFHENYDAIVQQMREVRERTLLEGLLSRLRASAVLQWKRTDLRTMYERRGSYR